MGRKADLIVAVAAVLLFIPLFIFRAAGPLDFWWWMSLNIILAVALGAALDGTYLPALGADFRAGTGKKIVLGLLSAAVLYAVFFAGNYFSRLLFPFAGEGIGAVYAFKSTASFARIVPLMVFLIGPGEEVFWRGFLQRRFQGRFGPGWGFLVGAALYAAVHAGSGNLMLVMAAAVCGLFWGYLYMRTNSVLLVAVSHTAWDLAVFVAFPFGS